VKYLTFNELREKLGNRGRTTIYRDIAAGRLPKPIKLGSLNYFPEHLVDEAMTCPLALEETSDQTPKVER
jgi:predicted DNA-binding transcriptional regulator AlpA